MRDLCSPHFANEHPTTHRALWVVPLLLATLVLVACSSTSNDEPSNTATNTPTPVVADSAADADNAAGEASALLEIDAGRGWSLSVSDSYAYEKSTISVELLNAPAPSRSQVLIHDGSSGAIIARIEASLTPIVLSRRSAAELLVSDDPIGGDVRARLLVFDLSPSPSLLRTIPLQDRYRYNLSPSGGFALSANERYLYYLASRQRPDPPGCEGAGGEDCAIFSLGIVDLAATSPTPTFVALPDKCGVAGLSADRGGNILAACPLTGNVFVVSGSGAILDEIQTQPAAGPDPDPELRRGTNTPMYAFRADSGNIHTLLQDGILFSFTGGEPVRRARVLPPGMRLWSSAHIFQTDDGNVLVGFRDGHTAQTLAGVATLHGQTGELLQTAFFDGEVEAFAPIDASTIRILDRSGRIDRFDLDAQVVTTPPGASEQIDGRGIAWLVP